jgi:hypothetical protein
MAMTIQDDLIATRQEIESLKQQLETAKSQDARRLRQRLKELQVLQLWRICQMPWPGSLPEP